MAANPVAGGGVGKTALGVAMIRAWETDRPDRLFSDPFAQAFLDAAPGVFEAEEHAAAEPDGDVASWGVAFWEHAVVRTRFFDDWLLTATRDSIRQVVILAAGLDTRAYRLVWPAHVTVYELDLPEMFEFKDSVLAANGALPHCERRTVSVDLRQDWGSPLVASGFHPGDPAAWLIEGLLIYLSEEESAAVLHEVGRLSVAGSRMAFEHDELGTDSMRARAPQSKALASYSAMWKGGIRDPRTWLCEHGWRPERHDRAAVAVSYSRPLTIPSTGGFITATRL